MCASLGKNSVHLKVPFTFSTPSKCYFKKRSYFKTCHSIEAHLISRESGISNYLTAQCLMNKLLINFLTVTQNMFKARQGRSEMYLQ